MRKISIELVAAAALLGSATVAGAADFGVPYAPSPVIEPLIVGGGWYIRGDIGVGIDRGRLREPEFDAPPAGYRGKWVRQSIDDSLIVGGGIGYKFSEYLRGDITAEYRASTAFHGIGAQSGVFNTVNGTAYANIRGSTSSTVALANVYADLGTYWGLTPYVGAGVGFSYNRITGASQSNTIPSAAGPVAVNAHYKDASKVDLAWALHGGVSYDVNERLKLDASYRYLDMGTATTGNLYGLNNGGGQTKYTDKLSIPSLTAHDLRIGMRWMLQPPVVAAPVIAKN